MRTFLKINAVIAVVGIIIAIIGFATFDVDSITAEYVPVSYEESLSDKEISDADTLIIRTGFSSLTVAAGDEVKLVAENVPEAFAAHLSSENNTISLISDNMSDFKGSDLLNGEGKVTVNFNNEKLGSYTLYVPENIEKLDMDFCFGELNFEGITAKTGDIDIAFSDCRLSCSVTNNLDIDSAFGDTDIDMNQSECRNVNISSGFGDCDIKNLRITGSADVDNSFGDLSLILIGNDYDIDCDSAFGSSSLTGEGSSGNVDVDVSNAFGNITINNR